MVYTWIIARAIWAPRKTSTITKSYTLRVVTRNLWPTNEQSLVLQTVFFRRIRRNAIFILIEFIVRWPLLRRRTHAFPTKRYTVFVAMNRNRSVEFDGRLNGETGEYVKHSANGPGTSGVCIRRELTNSVCSVRFPGSFSLARFDTCLPNVHANPNDDIRYRWRRTCVRGIDRNIAVLLHTHCRACFFTRPTYALNVTIFAGAFRQKPTGPGHWRRSAGFSSVVHVIMWLRSEFSLFVHTHTQYYVVFIYDTIGLRLNVSFAGFRMYSWDYWRIRRKPSMRVPRYNCIEADGIRGAYIQCCNRAFSCALSYKYRGKR